MISSPQFWKSQIFDGASELRDKIEQKQWPSRSVGRLERIIMTSCYAIRKLYEAGYIDDEVYHEEIPLRQFNVKNQGLSEKDWCNIGQLYDLERSKKIEKKFSYFCNQMIHSRIFFPIVRSPDDKGLFGVAFNSDRTSKHSLYYIQVWDLIDSLAKAGDGYVGKPVRMNVGTNGELTIAE